MIRATGHINGRRALIIGLSDVNLEKFKAKPLDTFIVIKVGELTDEAIEDVYILSGKTEQEIENFLAQHIPFLPGARMQ